MPDRVTRCFRIAHARRAALLAVALVASACSTFTTYKTAGPPTQGRTQTLVAPQLNAAGPKETGKAPFPELAVSVRHGASERLELGGTATVLPLGGVMSALGLEATARLHVHRTRGGRVDVAVAAGLGYRVFRSSGAVYEMVHGSVPLMVGINLGDDQLVLSPTVAWQRWYASGAHPVNIPSAGLSVGYRWQITRGFALFPELSWATSSTVVAGFDDTALLHAGVALVFGGSE